jgi:DnaK suppressor protein
MTNYTAVRSQLEEMLRQKIDRAERIDHDLNRPTNKDWEERAVELEDDDTLMSVGKMTLAEIDQIKHAIHQIDAGTYGICSRCGSIIAPGRLELIPYATTCVRCA